MGKELGRFRSYQLNKEELENLTLGSLLPEVEENSELYKLFSDIKSFNLLDTEVDSNFIAYYCNKHNLNCDSKKEKNHTLNTLRVRKKRLNDLLKNNNYEIDRNYHIHQEKIESFENMICEGYHFLHDKDYVEIKIFDTYTSDKEDKAILFSNKYSKKLKSILKNEGKVEFISVFDNKNTKEFCENLLNYNENKSFDLTLKYINTSLPSLFYILLTDVDNRHYIAYYEDTTKWSVVREVSEGTKFSTEFYDLLDTRFKYFFELDNLEVMTVNSNTFKYGFDEQVIELVGRVEDFIHADLVDIETIEDNSNQLIGFLRNIRIANPNMDYAYKLLHYYIKLIEIVFTLEVNKDKSTRKNTNFVFTQLFSHGIVEKLNKKITSLFGSKDEFLLEEDDFYKINISKMRKNIQIELLNNDYSLADIFDNLNWNTEENILHSFNKIITDKRLSLKLINYCLKKRSKKLEGQPDLIKYIVRKIFTKYDIGFHGVLNTQEKEIVKSLHFFDPEIENIVSILN